MSDQITASKLRKLLFETICDLKEGKISVEKAKQIASSAQVIINLSKVEIDFAKLAHRKELDFFPESIDETLRKIEDKKNEPYNHESNI